VGLKAVAGAVLSAGAEAVANELVTVLVTAFVVVFIVFVVLALVVVPTEGVVAMSWACIWRASNVFAWSFIFFLTH